MREWWNSFFASLVTLFLLVSAANLIANFLRRTVTSSEVLRHYILDIPNWMSKILPLSCLIATLFCLERLKNKNELITIFASGFGRRKFLVAIFLCALSVAGFQFLNVAYLAPYSKVLRHRWLPNSGKKFSSTKSQGLSTSIASSGKIWFKGKDYFLSFKGHDTTKNQLKGVSAFYFDQNFQSNRLLKAKRATLAGDKKNQWKLSGIKELSKLSDRSFPQENKYEEVIVDLDAGEELITQIVLDITTLPLRELYQYVQKVKSVGVNVSEYEVLLYEKIQNPVLCLIFTFLPISGVFQLQRRGSGFGKNVVIIFIFILGYWFLQSSLQAMGANAQLHPFMAMFGIPVVFLLYVLYLIAYHRKLR